MSLKVDLSASVRAPRVERKTSPLGRYLGGTGTGVGVGAGILIAAWLAVPRAVEPRDLPLPRVDRIELRRLLEGDTLRSRRLRDAQSQAATAAPVLPFEVRGVGESLRRYGLASAAQNVRVAREELSDLRLRAAEALRKHGAEPLLNLRALQESLFVGALGRWEARKVSDAELTELGGNFAEKAVANGWFEHGALLLDDAQRRVLFRLRWGKLTALDREPAVRPRLAELVLYHRTLLEHPDSADALPVHLLLGTIADVARLDPSYPAALARGIVFYRAGNPGRALQEFRGFVAAHPRGPWSLRAHNYLLAAAEHVPPVEDGT